MKKFLNISLLILSLNAMQKPLYTMQNPANPAQSAAHWANPNLKFFNQPTPSAAYLEVTGADQLQFYKNLISLYSNPNCVTQCFQAHPLPPMIDNCKVRLESSSFNHKDIKSIIASQKCLDFVQCLVSKCGYVPAKRII
jgi:hypothetical protein